ncbi:tetratricopeptide repeat protein [Jonesiaceae bacterium BS-20]|uniref:Tetratricopeptide repeat protein n=1 Tax=Jonesiaceae bacterium BS-20 TaxID=3120821 RepID=A0AAU7DR33_9MICO
MNFDSAGAGLEPDFVGQGRKLLVDGLLAIYDRVNQTGSPAWVSIEAPSGVGKTRIVREFYNRLAGERQPQPAYWPGSILGSRDMQFDDVSARRKQVYPEVTHVPGSLPAFFWWGITASLRSGTTADALAADLGQLKAHEDYLDDAWGKLTTWGERNPGWWKNPTGAALEEGITTVVGSVFESLAGTVVPGVGLIRPALGKLQELSKSRAASRDRLAGTQDIAPSAFDAVEETFTLLSRLAIPGLPIVIFVEDFHAADQVLADLVARCATSEAAILVITTSWPGYGEQREHIRDVLERTQDVRINVAADGATLPAPFQPGASLAPLGAAELATVIQFYYPLVDPQTLSRLAIRYSNPLALELFCTIERYRRRFPEGDLKLSEAEIEKLPRSIEDLYRSVWEELPKTVREALVFASLGVPVSVQTQEGMWDLSWHRPLLVDALTTLNRGDSALIAQALSDPTASSTWARQLSHNLRAFHEPVQWQIALSDDEFLFEEDREEFFGALATAVTKSVNLEYETGDDQDQSAPDKLYRARLAQFLFEKGLLAQDALAIAVLSVQVELAQSPLDLPNLVQVSEGAMNVLEPHGPVWCAVAERYARALWKSGRRFEGARQYETVIAARMATGEPDDLKTLELRTDHALLVTRHIDAVRGAELFEQLTKDVAQIPDAPTYALRHIDFGRAEALTKLHQLDQALPLLAQTLQHTLGDADPDQKLIAAVRSSLAEVYFRLDRPADGLMVLEDSIESATQNLGADSLDTLILRANLAGQRSSTGLPEHAITEFEPLIVQMIATLGLTHPVTTAARTSLAFAYRKANRLADAHKLFAAIYADIREHLGANHPEIAEIQFVLLTIGQQDEAWEFLIEFLEAEIPHHGHEREGIQLSSSPRTVLAQAYALTGQHEQALNVCATAIELLSRYEEPSHFQTIELQTLQAQIQFVSGNEAQGIRELEELAELCERAFGAEHERTQYVQAKLVELQDT